MRAWKSDEKIQVSYEDNKVRKHRLKLSCTWDDQLPECLYIMLNPSTADQKRCDPTLGRCISLAKSNGYGAIKVVNWYSFRTPKPKLLWEESVKSHPNNIEVVTKSMKEAELIIVAWGGQVRNESDFSCVLDYANEYEKQIYCLGKNKSGTPKHPLYVRGDSKLERYVN